MRLIVDIPTAGRRLFYTLFWNRQFEEGTRRTLGLRMLIEFKQTGGTVDTLSQPDASSVPWQITFVG